ncbi:MAG TPA: AraC family transcriptional regulator [Gemmatimonadaceae bacterium]|nr:AraC family transcriptional regulator [Gemmatimonadaceae bacterium]
MGRFGLDGLIVHDQDDSPAGILAVIDQAEARGLTQGLRGGLRHVKPTVRDATLIAVTRAHQRLSPERLTSVLGIRRATLTDRLREARFPPPQRLITWGRLIVAAQMLEDPERSADSIALALDFPSGSAFRNICRRYLQATPLDVRARGGSRWVLERLLAELRAGREVPLTRRMTPFAGETAIQA